MKKILFGIALFVAVLLSTFYLSYAGVLTLDEIDVEAYHQHTGDTLFVVSEGQRVRIETSPGGAEILDFLCPAGKQLDVKITIRINEVDAE
jgi:hypothetical protein